LYERRDDNTDYNLKVILEENGVSTNQTEVARLADDLKTDKYIHLKDLSSVLKKARITSKGVDYCEADSYSKRGQSIVNNYHITNSPQANIVVNSSQVEINQTQQDKAESIINEIRDELAKESFELEFKKEVLECLTEIQNGISSQKAPKFAIKSLLSLVGNSASISGLALSLAQVFGYA
jgi:hypothetical protein